MRAKYRCVEPVAVPRTVTGEHLENFLQQVWAAQGVDVTAPHRHRRPSLRRRIAKHLKIRKIR
jgi:hypothetical protein